MNQPISLPLFAGLSVLLVSCCAGAQAKAHPVVPKQNAANVTTEKADQAASKALDALRSAITVNNYKQFGFDSLADVQHMSLGTGVPLFSVRADQLQKYVPGTDPGSLMIPTQRRIYPVLVNGVGKLVVTMAQSNNEWNFVSFDQQEIATPLSKIEQDKVSKAKGPGSVPENYFALQIPSMHLSFLAFSSSVGPGGPSSVKRQVQLTALSPTSSMQKSIGFKNSNFLAINPQFSPEREGVKSAADVFKVIAPQASAALTPDAPK